jgi:hypothetical protein
MPLSQGRIAMRNLDFLEAPRTHLLPLPLWERAGVRGLDFTRTVRKLP